MKKTPALLLRNALLLILIYVLQTTPVLSDEQGKQVQQAVTTVYLIRHTEKELDGGKDPKLTEQGVYRANNWARIFADTRLDAVYSTDTTRTRSTAQPIADSQGKEIKLYTPFGVDFEAFVEDNKHQAVLVVGHSNTISAFANALIGQDRYQELDESNYDTLYIVDIAGDVRTAKRFNIAVTLP